MRNKIIAEARDWLQTPYKHQAMVKHIGVDCVGFIVGVGLNTGALTLTRQQIKAYGGYGRLPNPKAMGSIMKKHLIEILPEEVIMGDIAWIQWRKNLPMHLALVGEFKDRLTLIHAYSNVGRVVEHSFTEEWNNRIHSFWRYPGIV